MTTPQRWQEIDRIFAAALELEPSERSRFVAQACVGDEELRKEVESLLTNDSRESLAGGHAVEEATRLLTKVETQSLEKKKIGPYEIIRSLGGGGMGHVYLAHDTRLNRPVALKMLSFYDAAEQERLRRFRQEALAASALNHPNILTIYEIGAVEGHNFIVTEFVDGQTLLTRIQEGPLSVITAVKIAIQVASALSAAHEAGIVHRDIKPANIMVRRDGLVKVLDFGIAKYTQPGVTDRQETILLTMPGSVVGTAAYMSPEQARGYPIDPRTDIWSLGVILYEMVSGRRPFQGDTPLDLMSAVIQRNPPSLSESGVSVPESLERIINKTLSKDRDGRYQAITEVLADLKALKKNLELEVDRKPIDKPDSKHETTTSIAVLPFVNMSADPENEYFCDGLSEELLNALTKIEGLKVAARTSAFSFKGKNATVSAIGRALNVTSVLEGSVRKSGDRLRITVQLINAEDGYHLWSDRYDREMKDIFDIQDEITLAVVDALKVKLIDTEKTEVLKRYTENVEAYQLYLKGRFYWWKTAPEEFAKGRDYFERAVEIDPSYALSYCGLSSYYGFGSAWGMVPPDVGWPKAVAANEKALDLDATLAEVHTNAGGINMVYHRDPVEAEKNIKRALELNPRFQETHYLYSFFLLTRGRFNEAIAEARLAIELDPFSVRLLNHLGFCYYLARRYEEAITQYRHALEMDENNPVLHDYLGDALARNGMHGEAVAEWRRATELSGDNAGAIQLGNSYKEQGFEKAVRVVSEGKLEQLTAKRERGDYVPEIHFVRALLGSGNNEEALVRLEKACEERNVFPLLIDADPLYDGLRSDPRFVEALRRSSLRSNQTERIKPEVEKSTAASQVATLPEHAEAATRREQAAGPRSKSSRYILIGGLLGLMVLVIGLVYWFYPSRRPAIESIAVLPFKNESGNSDLEYLSDGMTDSLINSLSRLPNLSVKARSSVFRYKGKEIDPKVIASELSVQAILSGRLVQRGDELTLFLSLVDASSGNQLWGEEYDRKVVDLISLQREITLDVSQKLRVRLSGAEEKRVTKDYTANTEAYQLFLRGRFHVTKLTPPEVQLGIKDFQDAIQIDQNYALAYVGLSEAYRSLSLGGEQNPADSLPKAIEAAQKAINIDDGLAEAHTALGASIFWYEWKWSEAENQYRQALKLNPNSPDTHLFYAHLLSNTGRHVEALAEIERARALDPLSPLVNSLEGQFLLHAGKPDEALIRLRQTFELAPAFWLPHVFAASAYIAKGMYVEAIAEARKATELSPAQTVSIIWEGYALAKIGRRDQARAILESLLKLSKERFVPPSHIATLYNGLGERDETIEWLERGVSQRDPKMTFLKVDPKWNNLRDDPGFQDVLRKVGF